MGAVAAASVFRCLCAAAAIVYAFSSFTTFFWCRSSNLCYASCKIVHPNETRPVNLLSYPYAWNSLDFPAKPPSRLLKIAVFVKKWPHRSHSGGLERHALTLHLALARRGHEIHIFTALPSNSSLPDYSTSNLHFHLSNATAAGYLNQATVWEQFQAQNSTGEPFDMVHSESVGLMYTRSRTLTKLAVSWHGIAYETVHTDVIQELQRDPGTPQATALTERLIKVVKEVKFFPFYAHHVATSDHAGNVLKRIYMLPEERVHIILNGVDEAVFHPDSRKRLEFRRQLKIPGDKSLVLGMAGRLVKDKGHPLIFEALSQMLAENVTFRKNCVIIVAGDGPWGSRYRELRRNALILGPLDRQRLAMFYNAIDVFVNPTFRAQGLDHTLLEAMLSGKPVMATRVASITGSVVVGPEVGYTFSPSVASLKNALYKALEDGNLVLEKKGEAARQRALKLFTASRMAAAYEKLFLCLSSMNGDDCYYRSQSLSPMGNGN